MKINKHRNIQTVVDGIKFASRKEARRYSELKLLERAGKIQHLQLQPRFDLIVNSHKICTYVADFCYAENKKIHVKYVPGLIYKHNNDVVEDVKGQKSGSAYAMFRLKKKLMLAILDIDVKEI